MSRFIPLPAGSHYGTDESVPAFGLIAIDDDDEGRPLAYLTDGGDWLRDLGEHWVCTGPVVAFGDRDARCLRCSATWSR